MSEFAPTTEVGFPGGFPPDGFPDAGFPVEPPSHGWSPFPPILATLIYSVAPAIVVSGSTNTFTVHGMGLAAATAGGFNVTGFGLTWGTFDSAGVTSMYFTWTAPDVSVNTGGTLEVTVGGHNFTLLNALTIVPIIEV